MLPILAIGLILCGIMFFGPLKPYIIPPVKKFILIHLGMLVNMLWYFFISCCLALTFLLVMLDWDNKRLKPYVSKYKSAVVAKDYYKDVKGIDYYRAIRTLLGRSYRLGETDEEEKPKNFQQRIRKTLRRYRPLEDAVKAVMTGKFVEPTPEEPTFTDGVHKTYYPNDKVETEATYVDGKRDGVYRIYYDDGRVNVEKNYKKGILHGPYKAYDEYGTLYFEMNYKEGKKDGIENTYYHNGVLQFKDIYREGVLINRKTYDDVGELKFDYTYVSEEEEDQSPGDRWLEQHKG